jgi:hypothetical protein
VNARIALALLATGLAGCGDADRIGGRPGGDQTENGITARIVDSSGRTVAGARVLARPANWSASGTALDSAGWNRLEAVTDEAGKFVLQGIEPGNYRIEVRDGGRAAQWSANVGEDGIADAGTITVAPRGGLRGKVPNPGAIVSSVGLWHWTKADSLGGFALDSLPPGAVELVSSDGAHGWLTVWSGAQRRIGTLRPEPVGQILLDDFEDGDSRHRWGPLVGLGWWYAAFSTSVVPTPAGIKSTPADAVDSTSPERRNVLHARFDFSAGETSPWAEVGVEIRSKDRYADLRGLSALSFLAKGTGTVTVYVNGSTHARIAAKRVLSAEWTEIRIPVDSFVFGSAPVPDSTAMVLSSAGGLSWHTTSSADIWLDDIRLIGVTPASVWGDVLPP